MATLSPPTFTTTTHTPFLPKTRQLSIRTLKKINNNNLKFARNYNISCNANGNHSDGSNGKGNTPSPLQLDRRNILIGLGGMYGAATLGGGASAAPIAPDVNSCTLTDAKFDYSVGDRCCPPAFGLREVKEYNGFVKEASRVRRPAHKAMLDEEWLADYKRAIGLMKSLPMSDPRNFIQQAKVHCAYCDGAYPVVDHPDQRYYEVHGTWLFAPFHRWYLHFFEKILGKLIGKDDFALPYWNWDHPDGMRIPEMFKDMDSPLYDPNRNKDHLNAVIDLAFNANANEESGSGSGGGRVDDEDQIKQNLLLMRKQMLYPSKPSTFFGGEPGTDKRAGALEFSPHNNVHLWTGSATLWANQDMGSLWSAARDPIFYCLHSNVDRMWSIWRNELPGRFRKDIDFDDYLNSYFILYDENANPVKVYVKDSLDTDRLGYKYEDQDLLWLTNTKVPRVTSKTPTPTPTSASSGGVAFPKPLDGVIKTWVPRPRKSRSKADVEEEEEVLVISMDITMSTQPIKYDVFINDGYDQNQKPGGRTDVKPQYAGSFTSLGHRGSGQDMAPMTRKTQYRVPLSTLLDDIGASDDDYIQVTLIPKVGATNVVVNGIMVEYVRY